MITQGLSKGLVKLCWLNKAIIADINLVELVQSAIVAVGIMYNVSHSAVQCNVPPGMTSCLPSQQHSISMTINSIKSSKV